MSVLELQNVNYYYTKNKPIIYNCNYQFEKGKVYAIVGKSGAGKTTLLSMLSGLVQPKTGTILYDGKDITTMSQFDYRSNYVGVIFQSYNLLPNLTAIQNVLLSMDITSKKISDKDHRAVELLEQVGLSDHLHDRKILKLSGGEQQRVAIARTLSYDPDIILADEPTGNLDSDTEQKIMNVLIDLARNENRCIIIVTHSTRVANMVDEVYKLPRIVVK